MVEHAFDLWARYFRMIDSETNIIIHLIPPRVSLSFFLLFRRTSLSYDVGKILRDRKLSGESASSSRRSLRLFRTILQPARGIAALLLPHSLIILGTFCYRIAFNSLDKFIIRAAGITVTHKYLYAYMPLNTATYRWFRAGPCWHLARFIQIAFRDRGNFQPRVYEIHPSTYIYIYIVKWLNVIEILYKKEKKKKIPYTFGRIKNGR